LETQILHPSIQILNHLRIFQSTSALIDRSQNLRRPSPRLKKTNSCSSMRIRHRVAATKITKTSIMNNPTPIILTTYSSRFSAINRRTPRIQLVIRVTTRIVTTCSDKLVTIRIQDSNQNLHLS